MDKDRFVISDELWKKIAPLLPGKAGDPDATNCSILDDHIDPRRSAFFMARSVSGSIREDVQC